MSAYMSRLFPKSNSSFLLTGGVALKAKVLRQSEDMYVIDAGVGRPRAVMANELIKPPKSAGPATFTTKVGFLNRSRGEPEVRTSFLQRYFVDMVTGDPRTRNLAAARFEDAMGESMDAAGGAEQPLLMPRKLRKQRALAELKNLWQSNRKVKGFIVGRVKGGYTVAIGGYIAFLPNQFAVNRRMEGDRFVIQTLTPQKFLVSKVG